MTEFRTVNKPTYRGGALVQIAATSAYFYRCDEAVLDLVLVRQP
jgi:hypothetical protein